MCFTETPDSIYNFSEIIIFILQIFTSFSLFICIIALRWKSTTKWFALLTREKKAAVTGNKRNIKRNIKNYEEIHHTSYKKRESYYQGLQ